MSPPVAIAVVILFNVGVLAGGVIWLRRQMKRVVAERNEQERDAGEKAARGRDVAAVSGRQID